MHAPVNVFLKIGPVIDVNMEIFSVPRPQTRSRMFPF